ncbi:hypothetical protein T459_17802 [Capsicum annuum]|uniref:FHA domain-containing protein n=1 Tax=Capsicum annuum TaxID=4072 RepID=A0A2G2ZCM2_CAPAN|nr:hypothetical protein T459_17802 [Capsicum annuum]
MVSPKQPTGSLAPIRNKRPSLSSDDVPPFSKHPEVDDSPLSVKRVKVLYRTSLGADSYQSIPRLLIVCGNDQHQGKWVALLDRKGSGHVQVNGKTISKYSFCFLNSGDEVVLSQGENNAYLLLESPSDVGTSARKGKPLNIENQVEDALAIAGALIC